MIAWLLALKTGDIPWGWGWGMGTGTKVPVDSQLLKVILEDLKVGLEYKNQVSISKLGRDFEFMRNLAEIWLFPKIAVTWQFSTFFMSVFRG